MLLIFWSLFMVTSSLFYFMFIISFIFFLLVHYMFHSSYELFEKSSRVLAFGLKQGGVLLIEDPPPLINWFKQAGTFFN